jgi:uncharacterized protein
MEMTLQSYLTKILNGVPFKSAQSVIELTAEGGTVPFIARYRKEKTGNLDEVQIRAVIEAHETFNEIIKRKVFLVKEIGEQGNLTAEIKKRIEMSFDLAELEEIYRPFKKKKKTKATIARDAGLEPLANWIWDLGHALIKEDLTLEVKAKSFLNIEKKIITYEDALKGAQDIIIEKLANIPELRVRVHQDYMNNGKIFAKKTKTFKDHSKYSMYAEFEEAVKSLLDVKSSHRYLAMRRGWQEEELALEVKANDDELLSLYVVTATSVPASPVGEFLQQSAKLALNVYVIPSVVNEVHSELKKKADEDSIKVFAENVRKLLLASPYGPKLVLGVDPGLRTGCKVAMIDKSGSYISHTVVHISGDHAIDNAKKLFAEVLKSVKIESVAVGNGTGGRDAEAFFRKVMVDLGQQDVPVIMVNESGASVYSASDVARAEFPDLDITVRGAISIARRLQDPLSELVKIDPKSIGVGQYQHDVNQAQLKKSLEAVVESCVNMVGVDLNTASAPLLSFVSGIGPTLAQNIVDYRKSKGLFSDRSELLNIPRFSTKVFEQSAGFLRIRGGKVSLDNTGIHPERYAAVKDMAHELNIGVTDLIGQGAKKIVDIRTKWAKIIGEFTFDDILKELEKPGRDPRDPFKVFKYREDIFEVKDLKEGMICPGIVTNVTNFGAFVDVGVHQDGLVHISELSHQFIEDPRKVVNPGDQVTVRVLTVDLDKNQIGFSMKLEAPAPRVAPATQYGEPPREQRSPRGGAASAPPRRGASAPSRVGVSSPPPQRSAGAPSPRSGAPNRATSDSGRRPSSPHQGSAASSRPHQGGGNGGPPSRGGGQPFNNPFAALQGINSVSGNKK